MLLTEPRKIILFFKRQNCPKSNNGAKINDISRRGYYVRRITFQCLQAGSETTSTQKCRTYTPFDLRISTRTFSF